MVQEERQLDQMGALEAAYDDKLLDKQRENLLHYLNYYLCLKTQEKQLVIEDGFKQGIVKAEEKTLKAAAQYWHASRELERAKALL